MEPWVDGWMEGGREGRNEGMKKGGRGESVAFEMEVVRGRVLVVVWWYCKQKLLVGGRALWNM